MKTYRKVLVSIVRESCDEYSARRAIHSGTMAVELATAIIGSDPRENFLAIYLDVRHKVLASHIVSIGTVSSSLVHPREVFAPALALSASAIIVAHNHPSGDPTPSVDDRQVTERLRAAGELLGIELLDHLVIGSDRFFSFSEERNLPFPLPKARE